MTVDLSLLYSKHAADALVLICAEPGLSGTELEVAITGATNSTKVRERLHELEEAGLILHEVGMRNRFAYRPTERGEEAARLLSDLEKV